MKLISILVCSFTAFVAAAPALAQSSGEISLVDVYQSALEKNYGLQSQQYSYQAEKEGVRQAWAGVLPQVEASASYGVSDYTRDFDLQSSISDQDEHTRYDLSLIQVVYSRKAFKEIERAKAGEKLAAEELAGRELEIGYSVIEAFLRAQMLHEQIAIVEDERTSHERRLDQLENMLSRGFATRADTLDAQARIDEVSAELAGLRHNYRAAIKNLEAVAGIRVGEQGLHPVSGEIWRNTPSLLEKNWEQLAAENSALIRQAKGELDLAEATRKAESGAHWPELYLNARYTDNDTFATDLRQESRVELQLKLPIYKGGSTSSRVRQATQSMYAAEYAVKDSDNMVSVEISRITEELRGSYAQIQALITAEKSARAALEAAEKGFVGGVRSLNDLLDSRTRLSDIRRNLVNEVHQNHMLQFELRQVAGTLTINEVRNATAS
ncbi:TolC family protein [Marinobacter sp. ANT_B65]|uniref:TolC family protein n=1 Tax=Marinobacter sp. ANT_B65 TaxID=2039467 RepID=UPI000BBE6203|nr:TolC family protein [Marinobacter sp. ANT_B65]PCM45248.1 hypothetical protein CPA50_04340 [Marinobacter sp. ANT_B65]